MAGDGAVGVKLGLGLGYHKSGSRLGGVAVSTFHGIIPSLFNWSSRVLVNWSWLTSALLMTSCIN